MTQTPTKDLKALVTLLIEGLPAPAEFVCGDEDDCRAGEGEVYVSWHRFGKHFVILEGCEHRLHLRASVDDGGPCPPEVMTEYSPVRLRAFLQWMMSDGSMDGVRVLFTYAWFHGRDEKTDPAITKEMWGGRITSCVWRDLASIKRERGLG